MLRILEENMQVLKQHDEGSIYASEEPCNDVSKDKPNPEDATIPQNSFKDVSSTIGFTSSDFDQSPPTGSTIDGCFSNIQIKNLDFEEDFASEVLEVFQGLIRTKYLIHPNLVPVLVQLVPLVDQLPRLPLRLLLLRTCPGSPPAL